MWRRMFLLCFLIAMWLFHLRDRKSLSVPCCVWSVGLTGVGIAYSISHKVLIFWQLYLIKSHCLTCDGSFLQSLECLKVFFVVFYCEKQQLLACSDFIGIWALVSKRDTHLWSWVTPHLFHFSGPACCHRDSGPRHPAPTAFTQRASWKADTLMI